MFSWITKLYTIFKIFLDVWNYIQEYFSSKKRAEEEKRNQEREQAIEDSKKAETDDEIWDSQDRIVNNKPKP